MTRERPSMQELETVIVNDLEKTRAGLGALASSLVRPLQEVRYPVTLVEMDGGIFPSIVVVGLARRCAIQAGRAQPVVFPSAGQFTSRGYYASQIHNITTQRNGPDRPVLVVTNFLNQGDEARQRYQASLPQGAQVDVAAFQTAQPASSYRMSLRGMGLYTGIEQPEPSLFETRALAAARDTWSSSLEIVPGAPLTREDHSFISGFARRELTAITDQLYDQYFQPTPPGGRAA